MIRSTSARHLRHRHSVALVAAVVAASILSGAGSAASRGNAASASGPGNSAVASGPDLAALALASAPGDPTPASSVASGQPGLDAPATVTASGAGTQPSEAYEESLAHENDKIAFAPGGRVTVGFTPRSTDGWAVGGVVPGALPTGLATGKSMAASGQGSTWASPAPGVASTPSAPRGVGSTTASSSLAAVASPNASHGLRRQVFGFLPYWQLSGASTSLNYGVLTTIAYFSVGVDAAGNLKKRNSNGSLTTGWGGWTSSSMTSVINAAHAHGTRVVLTASAFAWTSGGAAAQQTLLDSSTARLNLARQLAAAVRDRGADGVNLDFEPLVSGQESNYVAFLHTLRSQLNAIRSGYQITFDTTGYIGNYPLEASVGPTAADAVFIMGYEYRTASSSTSGSVDPLSGPGYDLADTVREYTARISPSRVILGLPLYGRAWSTTSSSPRAANQSDAQFGYSTAVNYETIPALVKKYGRRWDSVEQSPYIVYQRQNCTSTYGCVTSWRQVWYDDAASIARRYQLVNDYGLRGAGMWALGYDGAYQEMVRALSDAFLVDHSAPQAGIRSLPAENPDEGIVVAWSASDVSTVRSYDVQVSVDAGGWTPWLTATHETTDVWLGADGHAYTFRVRATDSKGNVGAWNITATAARAAIAPASLAVGGFGKVTLDGLAYRAGPDTSAARLGSLPAGTVVALTSGPVSADGYSWYEVTQPIHEWAPASFVERGVWIAAKSTGATNVVPFHAPNATVVNAGLTSFDFGSGGLTGASPTAVAGRAFSPNGDGSRDGLRVDWQATVPLDSLRLNILRTNGTSVGSVEVPALTTGQQGFTWDGTVGGARVPDGVYLLQLVGTAGTKTYRAPSAAPATARQIADFAVTVDTVAPAISSSSASSSLISPNGDKIRDAVAFALRAPSAATWALRIAPTTPAGADPVRTVTGSGGTAAETWDGHDDAGKAVPDGLYTATLAACDTAGNCALRTYPVRVDTTPPTLTLTASPPLFSPNGDRAADATALGWGASETSSGTASVWRGTTLVRRWTVGVSMGGRVTWGGRNAAGSIAADGRYTFTMDVRDAAGNRRVARALVIVDRTVGWLRWSRDFYPQDGDALAPKAALTWRLTRTATTTLTLSDASGRVVRTVWSAKTQLAGARSWTWDGKLADGTSAPQGLYAAQLTVVTPYGTQTLTRSVWASAFPASLSSTSVKPGQVLTVNFSSAEPLRSAPRVTFGQPGLAAVTATATRLSNGTYRVRFTVRAGSPGTGSVRIAARDTAGRANTTAYGVSVGP